jgi:hypothetical protein
MHFFVFLSVIAKFREQLYRTDPDADAGVTLLNTGKNADARTFFFPALRQSGIDL